MSESKRSNNDITLNLTTLWFFCVCEKTDGHISESLKHIIVWKLINHTLEVQSVAMLACFIQSMYTVLLS